MIDTAEDGKEVPALVDLFCLAAQWRCFDVFHHRPANSPTSLEELIVNVEESLSALRLCQSCGDKGGSERFPKEAAFQLLFNEALTMQLPPHVGVRPEMNAFAKDTQGKIVTGELDFQTASDVDWAIELLRNETKSMNTCNALIL